MTRLILSVPVQLGDIVKISGDEHHYLSRVRRHRTGDRVLVSGRDGRNFEARIEAIGKKEAALVIEGETVGFRGPPVTVAVAVPKRNLMDDVVRKLSEIGVLRLVPLVAKRSAVVPSEDRTERWRRIADEARRQCGRDASLIVDDAVPFFSFILDEALPAHRLLLHPSGGAGLPRRVPTTGAVVLAIGPEGGFCEEERVAAAARGFEAVSLGMPVLRVETAAVAAAVLAVALRDDNV